MTRKTIGWVAKQAGVNTQTVLYYERRGLLPAPPRSISGYRLFNDETVQRIQFIKRAKELGFTLKQVITLLELQNTEHASCAEVSRMAANHLHDIASKIHDLESMRDTLMPLLEACPKKGTVKSCPIIESLHQTDKQGIS